MLFIIFFFAGGKRKGYQRIKTFLLFEYDNNFINFPKFFGKYSIFIIELFFPNCGTFCTNCVFLRLLIPDSGKESSWLVKIFMVF